MLDTLVTSTWSILFFIPAFFASLFRFFSAFARYGWIYPRSSFLAFSDVPVFYWTAKNVRYYNGRSKILVWTICIGRHCLRSLSQCRRALLPVRIAASQTVHHFLVLINFPPLGVVKKAVGSVLKIVHAEPISDVREYSSKDSSDLNNLIGNVKFTLLDPLRVRDLFREVKISVCSRLSVVNPYLGCPSSHGPKGISQAST